MHAGTLKLPRASFKGLIFFSPECEFIMHQCTPPPPIFLLLLYLFYCKTKTAGKGGEEFRHLENGANDCGHGKGNAHRLQTFLFSYSKVLLEWALPEPFREREQLSCTMLQLQEMCFWHLDIQQCHKGSAPNSVLLLGGSCEVTLRGEAPIVCEPAVSIHRDIFSEFRDCVKL